MMMIQKSCHLEVEPYSLPYSSFRPLVRKYVKPNSAVLISGVTLGLLPQQIPSTSSLSLPLSFHLHAYLKYNSKLFLIFVGKALKAI